LAIALGGAVVAVALNAILAVTAGLVAVVAVAGWLIGLALRDDAGAAGQAAARPALGMALGLACGMVALIAIGAWLVAVPQGNVLNPLDYLGQTLGLTLPASLAAAAGAAWLGARR